MPNENNLLPAGVEILSLVPHYDARGVFTEIFRESWSSDLRPLQWNAVRSNENVLRGFHAHWRHSDYLFMVSGSMTLGLKDLRHQSPSFGSSAKVVLDSRSPTAIIIPAGVGHGFYFPEESIHIYSVTDYWDPADELGCRWDTPGLEIDWDVKNPAVSARDERLPDLHALITALNEKLPQNADDK